jgi:hypothetical protein
MDPVRDCNTCRHHRQGQRPGATPGGFDDEGHFRCTICLLDLATMGELTKWAPEPPKENLEA